MKPVIQNQKWKNWVIGILAVLCLSQALFLIQEYKLAKAEQPKKQLVDDTDNEATFKKIETYLDSISDNYITDVKYLADLHQQEAWGCGPSSYALAKILDIRFFNNTLSIGATYNPNDPDEIIERFSFHQDSQNHMVDHAWLEVYLGDKFLFIDPTIGQFGVINKIAYQEFNVGDNVTQTLAANYDITDVRMMALVRKLVNRIPIEQEPYPGYNLDPSTLNYYLAAQDARNQVNDGVEPPVWTEWVDYLVKKYT